MASGSRPSFARPRPSQQGRLVPGTPPPLLDLAPAAATAPFTSIHTHTQHITLQNDDDEHVSDPFLLPLSPFPELGGSWSFYHQGLNPMKFGVRWRDVGKGVQVIKIVVRLSTHESELYRGVHDIREGLSATESYTGTLGQSASLVLKVTVTLRGEDDAVPAAPVVLRPKIQPKILTPKELAELWSGSLENPVVGDAVGVDSIADPKAPANAALPASGKWPQRKLILNAFDCIVPSHVVPGTWTGETENRKFDSIDYWQDTARLLEKGKFHGIFIADSYGFHDTYQGKIDASLKAGFQVPKLDPLLVVPIMAAVTTNLAFGITSSTTYEPPYALARRYTTLDHLTNGRVGWNIVTSHLPSAARNLGLKEAIEHDKRYEIADEYLDVVYKLWESSWHDDAVKRDQKNNIWTDPALVRAINHSGPHFPDIPGPFISHPSPQRTPALYQAGSSGAGTTFGAKHAEAVFIAQPNPELAGFKVAEYRAKVAEAGRDPHAVKVLPGLLIILGKTTEEAEEKYKYWKAHSDGEAALAFAASGSGTDWAQWGPDEELTPAEGTGGFAQLQNFKRSAPDITKWTRNVLADYLTLNRHGALIVGTPAQVADELERWVEVADVDGFNLSHFARNDTFEDIVELLIPELQRRGIFWEDYPEVLQPAGATRKVGITARESLSGVIGQKHLAKDHYGYRHKWL